MDIKYIGKTTKFLKHNYSYTVLFDKPNNSYTYSAHVLFNISKKEEMDYWIKYASQVSIKHNWEVEDIGISVD